MPKRSHLLLLTLAIDAMLLIGTMQVQAQDPEAEPPFVVHSSEGSPGSPISNTLTTPWFPTSIPMHAPTK
jgi:hypothetical protein